MKHQELINKMTLKQKAAFLGGKDEWHTRGYEKLGIPSISCSDGPSGLRKQTGTGDHLGFHPSIPATCFPSAATLANSWNTELAEKVGEAIGKEAKAEDVQVLLGPGLNVKRNPLCGRNFEYFSEDPYLSGKMAAAVIRGIQSNGVASCPKHFAVNSQETRRMAMNAVIDERTLREIYLTGFEIAVKEAKPLTIMSSYNEVNGIYANENRHLLKDILRQEWGFDGCVITDWGGSNDHVLGVKNGSTLEMPAAGLDSARELLEAVENGKISEQDIDERVDELLDLVLKTSRISSDRNMDKAQMYQRHHLIAQRAAEESAVLLKNEAQILPLKPKAKVAIIGDFAFLPRYQGAGSAKVHPIQVDTIIRVIEDYDLEVVGASRGYRRDGKADERLLNDALRLARKSELVLYFFGLNEQSEIEGVDRVHLRIPQNQIMLLEKLSQINPEIVGILSAGAVIEMPWQCCCKAILHGYLAGQAGAAAVMNLLTGKVNPSGRLSETLLRQYGDTPSYRYFPAKQRNSEYRESIYEGYRYFETAGIPIRYPFGFGLSYTTFLYSDLKVDKNSVALCVTNIGDRDGAETVQIYVSLPKANVFRAVKELKGFKKVFLKAGEARRVEIVLDDKAFRYWNVKTGRWEIESGTYEIMAGASVQDIRLKTELKIEKGVFPYPITTEFPYKRDEMHSYYSGRIQEVLDEEFCKLLGHEIPDDIWSGELGINDALCQMYYAKSPLSRLVGRFLHHRLISSEKMGMPDVNTVFQYNMPFRAMAKMTHGAVSMQMVDGIVQLVNGHPMRGLGKLIGGFVTNRSNNKKYEKEI